MYRFFTGLFLSLLLTMTAVGCDKAGSTSPIVSTSKDNGRNDGTPKDSGPKDNTLPMPVGTTLPASGEDKKGPATIKVLIPKTPTEVTLKIDGKQIEVSEKASHDGVQVLVTPELEAGKTYTYDIEATIVPNNYTKIFRTRKITFKAGDEKSVDLQKEDKATPDRIEVRWVPTPGDVVDKMCELAKVTKDDVIHDYGCGDAVMLIRPMKKYKAKKGFGNDIDPKMVKIAQANVEKVGLKDKITIVQGDILKMTEKDCAEATVVLLYLGDDLGTKLSPVLQKSLKPGARIVSHRFHLGDWKPDKTIKVTGDDGDEYTLHLWVVPEPKK